METVLMRGKPVADVYREAIAKKIAVAKQHDLVVTLAILVVGDDPASHVYKDRLVKLIESLGGAAKVITCPADTPEEEVISIIKKLNRNRYVTGIMPMMPMPKHINSDNVGAAVSPNKDVDCLNPQNIGDVFMGRSRFAACTPRACMATLAHYGIELEGKNVVVIGRSKCCRQAGERAAAAEKCYCYHLPFAYTQSAGDFKASRYYCSCSGQGLLCEAGNG